MKGIFVAIWENTKTGEQIELRYSAIEDKWYIIKNQEIETRDNDFGIFKYFQQLLQEYKIIKENPSFLFKVRGGKREKREI